jgi:hypothetical protein
MHINGCLHAEFHTSNSKGILVVAIKLKGNCKFREIVLLLYVLQRQYEKKRFLGRLL